MVTHLIIQADVMGEHPPFKSREFLLYQSTYFFVFRELVEYLE
jgi:hypothetical protein